MCSDLNSLKVLFYESRGRGFVDYERILIKRIPCFFQMELFFLNISFSLCLPVYGITRLWEWGVPRRPGEEGVWAPRPHCCSRWRASGRRCPPWSAWRPGWTRPNAACCASIFGGCADTPQLEPGLRSWQGCCWLRQRFQETTASPCGFVQNLEKFNGKFMNWSSNF